MILVMGKHGNHNKHFERPFDTDDDVIAYLREEGIDFDRLVEACRDRDQNVPRVENLITSEWTGGAPPGGYLVVKDERGDVLSGFTDGGSGKMTMSTYWSRFERAASAFDRCLETTSYEDLLSALSSGVSSIEAYIDGKVETHNRRHPEDELVDSKQSKVSFDDKIKLWVPRMSGEKFDKEEQELVGLQSAARREGPAGRPPQDLGLRALLRRHGRALEQVQGRESRAAGPLRPLRGEAGPYPRRAKGPPAEGQVRLPSRSSVASMAVEAGPCGRILC